jgi:hypothetical protein
MTTEFPTARPAAISQETRQCLDEYRGFRHIVRNVYTFNLRPSRLHELVMGGRPCLVQLEKDLAVFIAFLEQLGQSLGDDL